MTTRIKNKIGDSHIWVSADETTDIKGRCVVDMIVGSLNPEHPSEQFLVSTKFSDTMSAEKLVDIITKSVTKVSNGDPSKVLLYLRK